MSMKILKSNNRGYYPNSGSGVTMPDLQERTSVEARKLSDGDVALFIPKGSGASSVSEVRRVKVDEDGRGEIQQVPRLLTSSSVCIESLTDPNSLVFSNEYTEMAHEEQEESGQKNNTEEKKKKKTNGVASIGFHLDTEKKGEEHLLELNYKMDSGLRFSIEYNGTIDPSGSTLNLHGHYSILNTSGRTFKDASLFLLKEKKKPKPPPVQQEQQSQKSSSISNKVNNAFRGSWERNNNNDQESSNIKTLVSDALPNKVTLKDSCLTHVKFVQAKVPMTVFNLIQSIPEHVKTNVVLPSERDFPQMNSSAVAEKVICFNNNKENHLGQFLPSGMFTVSRKEPNGFGVIHGATVPLQAVQAGKTAFIRMGTLDRVVATRKVTQYEYDKQNGKLTETVEIILSNATKEEIKVTVMEAAYRGNDFELNGNGWEKGTNDGSLQTILDLPPQTKQIVTMYTIKYNVPVLEPVAAVEKSSFSSISKSNSNSKKGKGIFW
eukprot:TRINITY_DN1486_c0_g1_i1.p1 TRINITY_DN1486_c0_g1~~TRINITY_DN1486_c0_g1_i1.p1  ORF type:complete len:492 (-),score=192.70 TRINITY_DN1486_c0_g1_i1:111-1586(-)